MGSVRVAKLLALQTSDYMVLGLNPTTGGIQFMTVQHIIAQSLALSPSSCLSMT